MEHYTATPTRAYINNGLHTDSPYRPLIHKRSLYIAHVPPTTHLHKRSWRPIFDTVWLHLVQQATQEHAISQRASKVHQVNIRLCHSVCWRNDAAVNQVLTGLSPFQAFWICCHIILLLLTSRPMVAYKRFQSSLDKERRFSS